MLPATARRAVPIPGLEPPDERGLLVWTAIAMWLGGAVAGGAGALVISTRTVHFEELLGLAGFGVFAAILAFVVCRPLSDRPLYVVANIFAVLGAVAVWLACMWSGGPSSGLLGLFFLPALYDAYFFRPRHAVSHLALISVLVLSPLVCASSMAGTQFPARATVLLLAMWGLCGVVAARKRAFIEAALSARRQALSDPLTGLSNLRGLRDAAIRKPPAEGTGMLVIDIDDFKAVNTEYGHTGADELLRGVGSELRRLTGANDCVARIGGDEFAILVHGRTPLEVDVLAANCAQAVRRARLNVGRAGSELSASVGHALWPRDGRTLSELMAGADQAMFSTKATLRRASAEPPATAASGKPTLVDVAGAARAPRRGDALAGPRPRLARGGPDRRRPLSAPRGWTGWLRERPAASVAAAAAWLTASLTTLLAVLLPDADRSHLSLALALIAFAAAMALLTLLRVPAVGRAAYLIADLLRLPGLVLMVYLTGGTTSPLLPLALVGVAIAAYLSAPRVALVRLLGSVLVCASPFLYSSADAASYFVVRFITLVTTSCVLAGILLYSRRELAHAEQTASELASSDPLTGLSNRRAFERQVARAIEHVRTESGALLSISIIDLDNFKRVNDRHGHAAGDLVLRAIASALGAVTREEDSVARIGGDEFALVALGADASASRAIGERCVRAVERAVAGAGYGDCEVSATVGYAIFPHHGATLDALVEAADSALMKAKDRGKNTVASAPDPAPSSLLASA